MNVKGAYTGKASVAATCAFITHGVTLNEYHTIGS